MSSKKGFISQDSRIERVFDLTQSFFAVEVDLPEDLAERMVKFEESVRAYRKYLRRLEAMAQTRSVDIDFTTVEVPECLVVPKEEPPKKQATARRSSKKSPAKQKKTEKKSDTSPSKAE